METVTLTIDGKPVTVEKGKTVLEAVIQSGGQVPYYCYHPGIGVDGSCRVCIVKIEKMAKLQTSCSTPCGEGMVVTTNSPDVEAARASVFEFLLVNHPLDCPVCDKGGECPLQDFSYSYGPERSRMSFERRTFDGEGVKADIDFGPTLMLNRNRCILCTRCVRFMSEIDGDAQIGITNRGVHSEISTFEEKGVFSLLSGNLMDVCPVGAITTRDYRFKSRPWDNPQAVDTICTLCEKGCNVWALTSPLLAASSSALWMSKTPQALLGRVFAARRMIAMGAVPLAVLVAGPLAQRLFEPLLAPGGPLASSAGALIGVGAGRGIALMFVIVGALTTLTALCGWLVPAIRHVERDVPDAAAPAETPHAGERVTVATGALALAE